MCGLLGPKDAPYPRCVDSFLRAIAPKRPSRMALRFEKVGPTDCNLHGPRGSLRWQGASRCIAHSGHHFHCHLRKQPLRGRLFCFCGYTSVMLAKVNYWFHFHHHFVGSVSINWQLGHMIPGSCLPPCWTPLFTCNCLIYRA